MGPQNSAKGIKKLSIEKEAAIITYRKAGIKTLEIIVRVPNKRDRGQPAYPMVWKKYEEENE